MGPERAVVCCSSRVPSGLVYGLKAGEVRAHAPEGIALTAAAHAGPLCWRVCSRLWLCFVVPWFSWSKWFLESSHGFWRRLLLFWKNQQATKSLVSAERLQFCSREGHFIKPVTLDVQGRKAAVLLVGTYFLGRSVPMDPALQGDTATWGEKASWCWGPLRTQQLCCLFKAPAGGLGSAPSPMLPVLPLGETQPLGSMAPSRPLHLYDTPYEPVTGGLEADSDRPACPRPRESRLPEDDERPPEEYDQPWEWKKERISKAFAGEPGWRQRYLCRLCHAQGVHTAGPTPACSWYHGAISRTDAETLLRLCKEASYLVRNSETSKNDFSLSLKSSQGFMHMKLSRTQENKYVLGQHSPPFDSVPEIIHHYASRKLPIKGAEHMSLLYPVAIRTL
uniref:Src homology 2 domain containing F n=1 Tax=Anser cygnoides TaxID=8845 RepID=A0A8B9E956_ANSCY